MVIQVIFPLITIFFIVFATKFVNYYHKFYHIYKYLNAEQKFGYFKNNTIINFISKNKKLKNVIMYYILIPIIKLNYLIISLFITLLYFLCETEFDQFLVNKGIDLSNICSNKKDSVSKSRDEEKIQQNEQNCTTSSVILNENISSDLETINKSTDGNKNNIYDDYYDINLNSDIPSILIPKIGSEFTYINTNTQQYNRGIPQDTQKCYDKNLNIIHEIGRIVDSKKEHTGEIIPENINNSINTNDSSSTDKLFFTDNVNHKESLDDYLIINNLEASIPKENDTISMEEINFGNIINNMISKNKLKIETENITPPPVTVIKIGKIKK
jgi:hypothetical protein